MTLPQNKTLRVHSIETYYISESETEIPNQRCADLEICIR